MKRELDARVPLYDFEEGRVRTFVNARYDFREVADGLMVVYGEGED
jgi:hypothetical protein